MDEEEQLHCAPPTLGDARNYRGYVDLDPQTVQLDYGAVTKIVRITRIMRLAAFYWPHN